MVLFKASTWLTWDGNSLRSKSFALDYFLFKTIDHSVKLDSNHEFLNVKSIDLKDYVEVTDNRDSTTDFTVVIYPSKLTVISSLLLCGALAYRYLKR